MIYLLLGSDDYTKKSFIDSLVKEKGATLSVYEENQELPDESIFFETDLFLKPKVFLINQARSFKNIQKLAWSKNYIIVSVKSLDKRKKENKEFLENPAVVIKSFFLPHKEELDKWIISRAKELNAKINPVAVRELAIRLGRDDAKENRIGGKIISVDEVYSLWQADSELKKLAAWANGREITKQDVELLIFRNGETDALSITNAIADKNKILSLELSAKFLSQGTGGDEKSAVIQLNALLAEQFRNVAMLQDLIAHNQTETQILELTKWKSGRLFVMKKIAQRFSVAQVLDLLSKLNALDSELKSSTMPPKVMLDLILTQLLI